jgi:hypothetical protein
LLVRWCDVCGATETFCGNETQDAPGNWVLGRKVFAAEFSTQPFLLPFLPSPVIPSVLLIPGVEARRFTASVFSLDLLCDSRRRWTNGETAAGFGTSGETPADYVSAVLGDLITKARAVIYGKSH